MMVRTNAHSGRFSRHRIRDRGAGKSISSERLADGCLDGLPAALSEAGAADTIHRRVLDRARRRCRRRVRGGAHDQHLFGHRSSVDLALGIDRAAARDFFLVAPDDRERSAVASPRSRASPNSTCVTCPTANCGITAMQPDQGNTGDCATD